MRIAISPCPNDTFLYESLVAETTRQGGAVQFLDIAELNAFADQDDGPDLLKVSCAAAPRFLERYRILPAGGAFSDAIGPLVVRAAAANPVLGATAQVGLPGRGTSAHILWRAWLSSRGVDVPAERFLRFDRLPAAVARGEIDAAVVIHESRFTFRAAGLAEIDDLGRFWDRSCGLPVPLGCLLARRSRGEAFAREAYARVQESLDRARERTDVATPWIREHAQEMDDAVLRQHIEAYVTARSRDCGEEGAAAMRRLWDLAEAHLGTGGADPDLRERALDELLELRSPSRAP